MSREFKFRAWENGSMYQQVRCGGVFDSIPTAPTVWNSIKGDWLNLTGQPYTTVMQYTGLKDKNGVEIYEGDFTTNKTKSFAGNGFRGKGLTMLVEWDEGECFYCLSVYDEEYFGFKKLTKSSASDIEVIGNIYENPELLGGRQ